MNQQKLSEHKPLRRRQTRSRRDRDHVETRVFTGVSFQPETLRYLDALAAKLSTSRSWVLNQIVLEHAQLAHASVLRPMSTTTSVIS